MSVATGLLVMERDCETCGEAFIGTKEEVACPTCKGEDPIFLVTVRHYEGYCATEKEHVIIGHKALEDLHVSMGEDGHDILQVKEVFYV